MMRKRETDTARVYFVVKSSLSLSTIGTFLVYYRRKKLTLTPDVAGGTNRRFEGWKNNLWNS